ncbi:SseB family protein [Streptococcus dentapri]|uniref:SseB family protein n=1 Tax=Streptococcus dentapri TaxID=573564 RepID=A0ABV8D1T3_9STRE
MNKFNSELDFALRNFIANPDNFLDSLTIVNSFHSIPVLASSQPYAIVVDGKKVIPVFTSKSDLDNFRKEHPSAKKQDWIERPSIEVLEEAVENRLHGLVFNIKKSGDFANSTIFKSSEMIQFINTYTTLLHDVLGEENQELAPMESKYFVPVIILTAEDGIYQRSYPTLAIESATYIPIFTSVPSLAKWYNDGELGFPFRQAKGVVMTWTIAQIAHPAQGENGVGETSGVVINPLDDNQVLVNWKDID